jgi:hypothetical protein
MLAEGKIKADEVESLLDALSSKALGKTPAQPVADTGSDPKYLRVLVEGHDQEHGGSKVNVRVPFALIRAGMRLAALLPAAAHEPINRALRQNGVDIDISKIKPENLEDLVTHLRELAVDVDGGNGEKVRIFCE